MTEFHKLPAAQRWTKWDDLSKGKVLAHFKEKGFRVEEFGFSRSSIRTQQLPQSLRMTPDYIVQKDEVSWFVEVKGCKRVLRLKFISLFGMFFWDNEMPLRLAVYDSEVDRIFLFDMKQLRNLISESVRKVDFFKDNNEPYIEIPMPRDLLMRIKQLWHGLFGTTEEGGD